MFTVFALAGCAAPVGDLGRRDRGLYADGMTALAGPFGSFAQGEQAGFALTDDEIELRNVGWDLVRPPERDMPGNARDTFRWWQGLPDGFYVDYPGAYHRALITLPAASHETRFIRLATQARADAARLPAFRDVATRVSKADGARRGAVAAAAATPPLVREAERRVAENVAVTRTVCAALALRINAYRHALGRLMIETPSTRAVDAEAAIDALAWESAACLPVAGTAARPAAPRAPARAPGFHPRGDDANVQK
jgi:hypothetical protein